MLPAYAGMILEFCEFIGVAKSAPRVCGDDPHVTFLGAVELQCSPRMRG